MSASSLSRGMRFFLAVAALIVAASPLRADADLDAANRSYDAGSYQEAASLFEKIIETRGYSAALCFDLGNAEAKAGNRGAAILNYERARYLAPGEADIDHNLQLARKQAGLDPNSYRWWEVVLRSIDWTIWLIVIGVGLVLIFLAVAGLSYLSMLSAALKIPAPRLRTLFRAVIFIGIPVCLFMGYVELSTIGFNDRIEGVIVAPGKATLRLSPFTSSDATGTIPEGELVTVEDRHNDFLRIEARDHHFGWIEARNVAPIVAGSFDPAP